MRWNAESSCRIDEFSSCPDDISRWGSAQSAAPSAAQNTSPTGTGEDATLSSDELDGIVAPIALYPDALVAQILGAATFPYEIVDATLWLKDNSQLKGEALAKAVDQQSWDPSVKALTQFPSVLDNLAKNLAWTSALGEASATQQPDVMAAVQRMRAKAQTAGNLKSSPEIKVVQESPQTIVIQPANPQIVYVPVYNPAVIYGVPYAYPGYVYVVPPPSTAAIVFGVGIMVGAMVYGGCCGWGWSYWGTNWHSTTIIYNRNIYVGNSYWRGGYYGGGYRPGYPGYRPGAPGYRPGYPGYGRPPATTLPSPGNRRLLGHNSSCKLGQSPNAPGGGTRPGGEDRVLCRPMERIARTRPRVLDPARMTHAVISVRRRLTAAPRKRIVRMHFRDPAGGVRRAPAGTKVWLPRVAEAVARGEKPYRTRVGQLFGEDFELVR